MYIPSQATSRGLGKYSIQPCWPSRLLIRNLVVEVLSCALDVDINRAADMQISSQSRPSVVGEKGTAVA